MIIYFIIKDSQLCFFNFDLAKFNQYSYYLFAITFKMFINEYHMQYVYLNDVLDKDMNIYFPFYYFLQNYNYFSCSLQYVFNFIYMYIFFSKFLILILNFDLFYK
jgi:hypothetical protein